jgi:hypothetical protein
MAQAFESLRARHLRTTPRARGLFACNDGLQDILTADDPDGVIVEFDRVDYRADVALGVGIALSSLSVHDAGLIAAATATF